MHLVNPPPDSLYPGLHLEQRRSNLTIAPPLAPASRNRLLSNTRPAQHKRGDRVCLGGREKKKSFATFFGGESREGRKRERAPLSPQPSRARAFSVAGSARGIKLRALYLFCGFVSLSLRNLRIIMCFKHFSLILLFTRSLPCLSLSRF